MDLSSKVHRMIDFKSCAERYETELVTSVIPFWEKHCVDREFGGYFTSLDRDGSVYDTTKYMWMQWRIVYMFAELYLAGYRRDSYVGIAEQGDRYVSEQEEDQKDERDIQKQLAFAYPFDFFDTPGEKDIPDDVDHHQYTSQVYHYLDQNVHRSCSPV